MTQAAERLAPHLWDVIRPAVPDLVSLVLEATREKGIPVSACGEVTEYLETVPEPVETGAGLSVASPSITGIEKLIGEL